MRAIGLLVPDASMLFNSLPAAAVGIAKITIGPACTLVRIFMIAPRKKGAMIAEVRRRFKGSSQVMEYSPTKTQSLGFQYLLRGRCGGMKSEQADDGRYDPFHTKSSRFFLDLVPSPGYDPDPLPIRRREASLTLPAS